MDIRKPFAPVKEVRRKINNMKGFKFDPQAHRYTLNGVELLSVTTLIKKYEKPFEKVFVSQMVANKNKREGKKVLNNDTQVRRYWRMMGEHASSLGTAGHAFCVMYWMDPTTVPVTRLDRNAKRLMDDLQKRFKILNMEISRGNSKYMLGYTIDVEMQDMISGEYVLGDFKFSKAFTTEQYKALKNRLPGRLDAPFKDYRSIGLDKGKLQLNIYSRLYSQDVGFNPSYGLLFHVDGLSSYYGEKGYEIYKVEMTPKLVDEILKPQGQAEVLLDLI